MRMSARALSVARSRPRCGPCAGSSAAGAASLRAAASASMRRMSVARFASSRSSAASASSAAASGPAGACCAADASGQPHRTARIARSPSARIMPPCYTRPGPPAASIPSSRLAPHRKETSRREDRNVPERRQRRPGAVLRYASLRSAIQDEGGAAHRSKHPLIPSGGAAAYREPVLSLSKGTAETGRAGRIRRTASLPLQKLRETPSRRP